MDEIAISNFCKYLQIKTVQPNPDYSEAVEFFKEQSKQLELDFEVFELVPKNPIVFLTWKGTKPNLKSVLLNSHVDVVPVFPEFWKYDPFSAHIDEEGDIYARGSQDMKCVGIQYLEAIRRLKSRDGGYRPERTVHVLFIPDEEVGGVKGMLPLIDSEYFRKLNVGLVMDEGLASAGEEYPVYYGDRVVWWIRLMVRGRTGHGSQFIDDSAGVKMSAILSKIVAFRDEEKKRMEEGGLTLGDVTTVNITGMSGGVQHNVVPSYFSVDLDFRITPHQDLEKFREKIDGWIEEAGGNIEVQFVQYNAAAHLTDVTDLNPWWKCFKSVCEDLRMKIHPQVFPAGTDSRYIREKGIPAIGFSPMNHTPVLLHDHNERLNKTVFLKGIEFYEKLIPALAAVSNSD